MPPTQLSTAQYAHTIAALLRTKLSIDLPACCMPDGEDDGLFVTCRGDEILVYNSNSTPVDAKLVLSPGAELDRYHRTTGKTIEIKQMAPNEIEAFPLTISSRLSSGLRHSALPGTDPSCSPLSSVCPDSSRASTVPWPRRGSS
jgi:hypothetical protein